MAAVAFWRAGRWAQRAAGWAARWAARPRAPEGGRLRQEAE
jgi:hypothetical protein